MNSDQYRRALRRLGLNQVEAANMLGINPRTSRRYALGESRIPHAVELLLKFMLKEPGPVMRERSPTAEERRHPHGRA